MHFGIIAAGKGSRLKAEGYDCPKPLVPIGGTPMIGRLSDIFLRSGAESISIVAGASTPEVKDYMEQHCRDYPVAVNIRSADTPSSMHSLYEMTLLMKSGEPFIATTVDSVFLEKDFGAFVKAFGELDPEFDGLMAVTDFIDDEKPLYVSVDPKGIITGFHDEAKGGERYVSGGIYALGKKAADALRESMKEGVAGMRDFQRALIAKGLRLRAYPMGKIVDVDHAADVMTANRLVENERWQTLG